VDRPSRLAGTEHKLTQPPDSWYPHSPVVIAKTQRQLHKCFGKNEQRCLNHVDRSCIFHLNQKFQIVCRRYCVWIDLWTLRGCCLMATWEVPSGHLDRNHNKETHTEQVHRDIPSRFTETQYSETDNADKSYDMRVPKWNSNTKRKMQTQTHFTYRFVLQIRSSSFAVSARTLSSPCSSSSTPHH
jgi:hypothetical protein